MPTLLFIIILLLYNTTFSYVAALEFLFNSFSLTTTPSLNLTDDARVEPPVVRLTNDSNQFSLGRPFYPTPIQFKPTNNSTTITNSFSAQFIVRLTNDSNQFSLGRAFYPTPIQFKPTNNSTTITTSFSTQFIFSILPEISTSPGFGLAFVLSASTQPPNALSGQYFGLFSSATAPSVAPLLAIEFDTGRNPEFNDPDGNHVGVDLNNIESTITVPAGYYTNANGSNGNETLVPVDMRNGQNIHAWIDFNGPNNQINVTLAQAGMARPDRPLLSYTSPVIANYVSGEMYVGFSASKTTWIEAQRVLAWSFSDTGIATDINTTNLPDFRLESSSSSLSPGAISGIVIGCVALVSGILLFGFYWFWWRRRKDEDDDVEDWELEYWPHRFSNEELTKATDGFSKDMLLGSGGFGKVYKGVLGNDTELAVKCVNHDSKQGLKEFMAEISSMGRLQHKNLVQMRGWCRKGNELMLVYDYMPNGSLNRWIFDKPETLLNWEGRRRVLADVAEGLNYLQHGWEKVVVHRDIKSSNVLLDNDMRGRLGDFGLAKLYTHGEIPSTTRVVGTLGYLAPEVATSATPTAASDVYSFGVVVLEVACGRRPIETSLVDEEDEILIDCVRRKYVEGRLLETLDKRIEGEYEADELEAILKLGLDCCHPDPDRRPNMREVVAILTGEDVGAEPKAFLSNLTTGETNNDNGDGSTRGNDEAEETMPLQLPV